MKASQSFWLGKKVLVTGHTGFKGAWLSLVLNQLGADVHGLSWGPIDENSIYSKVVNPLQIVSERTLDIRKSSNVQNYIDELEPEIIFHLAAQSLVSHGYEDPLYTFSVNVIGTASILEAARKIDTLGSIVIVTSDKVYKQNGNSAAFIESDDLGGEDPYSSSKAAAEQVTTTYLKSFFSVQDQTAVTIARAGNVIGGGDFSSDRLVPDIFRSLQRSQDLELRYPDAIRPWQHVLDCVYGYVLLAEHSFQNLWLSKETAFNFGPDDSDYKSVRELVCAFESVLSNSYNQKLSFIVNQPRFKEALRLTLNSEKSFKILGWKPKISFHDSINLTCEWYLNKSNQELIKEITLRQVRDFLDV
jgi:CDP-glucose 4,6-dehydratase